MAKHCLQVLALILALVSGACAGQSLPQATAVPTVGPPKLPVTPTVTETPVQPPLRTSTPQPTGAVAATPASQPTHISATPASPSIPPLQPSPQGTEVTGNTVALRVVEYSTYLDSYGDLHIVGLVLNSSASQVTDPSVTAQLIASSGEIAATAEATVMLVGLPPGRSVPFEAIVPSPPQFREVSFKAEGYVAEVEAMPTWELKVSGGSIEKVEEGYVVRGKVQNLSTHTLSMASIAVIVRDASGRIIGVGSTDVGDALSPSAEADFELELAELGGSPGGLEFRAEGYPS
jgi:hypothetical protein